MPDQAPFAGLKVLTVATVFAAPFAAYQLGMHGAEVVAVEDPGSGDRTRTDGADNARHLTMHKMGPAFLAHAANKQSLTLNLKEPRGQELFRELARDADVIIENLRAGSMGKYGLGYEDLRELNPRLIYCSLTGFGQTGPKRRDPAIDVVVQALSGIMSVTGTPESGPLKAGPSVVDYLTGFASALAIVTALYHRVTTGKGQNVDVSMLETALVGMSQIVSNVQNAAFEPKLMGNRTTTNTPVNNTIMCRDAHIVVAAAAENLRNRFLKAIGRDDLIVDSRFATREAMHRNADALYEEIERTTKTRDASDWEEALNKAGVPCARVYQIREIIEHPQIKARALYHSFTQVPGIEGSVTVPMAPYKLSNAPARMVSPPPRLGQHTDQILRNLGYGDADIEKLRGAGII